MRIIKTIYFLKLFLISFIIVCICSCNRLSKTGIKNFSPCNPEMKLERLTRDILNKKYIYLEFDKGKDTYLIAPDFVKPNRIYFRTDSLKISSIIEDSIKDKSHNKIYFYNVKINNDTTSVELNVDFFATEEAYPFPPLNISTKESHFKFLLDSLTCNWIVLDSNSDYTK